MVLPTKASENKKYFIFLIKGPPFSDSYMLQETQRT